MYMATVVVPVRARASRSYLDLIGTMAWARNYPSGVGHTSMAMAATLRGRHEPDTGYGGARW